MDQETKNSPIIFLVKNNSNVDDVVTLFGHNHYINHANFGNKGNVTISSCVEKKSYLGILIESKEKPFHVGKIIIRFKNEDFIYYAKSALSHTHVDANGKAIITTRTPNNLSIHVPATQEKTDYIEITPREKMIIDGNSYFDFPIRPNSELTFEVYPEDKCDSFPYHDPEVLINETKGILMKGLSQKELIRELTAKKIEFVMECLRNESSYSDLSLVLEKIRNSAI